MQQYQTSQIDIFIILIITLCTVTVNLPFFNIDIALLKDLFSISLLFIPGYASLILVFPVNKINVFKRVLYSFIISFALLVLILIMENVAFNSLIITGANLVTLLASLTIILLIFAFLRRNKYSGSAESDDFIMHWIACRKCGGYYRLQEGESLEDFDSCWCGGELYLAVHDFEGKLEKRSEKVDGKKSMNFPLDLILMFVLSIIAFAGAFTPNVNKTFIITILALPFFLFFPGYLVIYILFPKKDDLEEMERLFLSFGLSLLITPVIGLILNYTSLGISTNSILLVLSIFTALLSIVALIKRWKVAERDRYVLNAKF